MRADGAAVYRPTQVGYLRERPAETQCESQYKDDNERSSFGNEDEEDVVSRFLRSEAHHQLSRFMDMDGYNVFSHKKGDKVQQCTSSA